MSTHNQATKVSFEDTEDEDYVLLEEITDEESKPDTTEETAMKNIFLSCDKNKSNSARVSDLINFMIPYMEEHISHLTKLQKTLDPNDADPCITKEKFYKTMIEWTSQFTEESVDNNNSPIRGLNKIKENKFMYSSSLYKISAENRFIKGCMESDDLNLSNSSSYSSIGNSGTDVPAILQEKINECEYQNRKLTEELEHSRSQLANSEEQNEALQANVQKLERALHIAHQTNIQLLKNKVNTSELAEASSAAKTQICKLEKDLTSSKKLVSKLKQQIHNFEIESQKSEDKFDQLMKRDTESKQLFQKLQTELEVKEQEFVALGDTFLEVTVELNEQKQLVSHYTSVNKSLKEDKLQMEKHYCDAMKTRMISSNAQVSQTCNESSIPSQSGTSQNPTNLIPDKKSCGNCVTSVVYKERHFYSPLAKFYKRKGLFCNNPKHLNTVHNPISSQLNNTTTAFPVSGKHSRNSDESPYFLCIEHEVTSLPTISSNSTPEKDTALLNQTPRSVVQSLPLSPSTKSPSNQYRLKKKSKIKKDFELFRQYRFVGSSSSDEEETNCQAAKHEYGANLNIVTVLEQLETFSVPCDEDGKTESSLPSMYVAEHSLNRRRCKSASSSNPNNQKDIGDISYEDDLLLWKSSQKIAPHESLESEISQAEHAEPRNTVEQLKKENDYLKLQISSSIEKVQNYYVTEHEDLKTTIQALQNDNNLKHKHIINIMDEKEKLHKELKSINEKDFDEIKNLKQNISELHHERNSILEELREYKKEDYDTVVSQLQSVKCECDLLLSLFQSSKRNSDDLCEELDKISKEKCRLKVEVDKLKQSMCEVNDKNKELYAILQCLSEEYVKIRTDDSCVPKAHDGVEITRQKKEEEIKSLKNRITEHNSIILSLKKELTDLFAHNCKLLQNTTETGNQNVSLKEMLTVQNANIIQINKDKEMQKREIGKLYEDNMELIETSNQTVKQIECVQKENEHLCVRLKDLEKENKSILAEFNIITGDYKNMKDSNNNLTKACKLLETEKEILGDKCERLTNNYQNLNELKEDIQQQLQNMTNAVEELSKPNQHSPTKAETQHATSSRRRTEEEGAHNCNCYTEIVNEIRQKIVGLENTREQLQSENKNLQEELTRIQGTYKLLAKEKEIWIVEKNQWLQLENEYSQKNSCSNCLVLKTEIEDLKELQKQNEKIIQSRRYDRMQTTIEKLTNETYVAEERLKSGKEKIANLELENFNLKAEMEENRNKYFQENIVLELNNSSLCKLIEDNLNQHKKEKLDLFEKMSNCAKEYKILQRDITVLEQDKKKLSQNYNILEKKLEALVKEKENNFNSTNKETNQLKQEIQELVKQNIILEQNLLVTTNNHLKHKQNIDSINKENTEIKQELEEANKQIIDFQKKIEILEQDLKEKVNSEQKLKDYQESVALEELNIKEQMKNLEKKLEKPQWYLQKSEARNLSIRKNLVDGRTVQGSDYTATEKLVKENYTLLKQLNSYENELAEIKIKFNDSNNCLLSLNQLVLDVNHNLNEKRQKLRGSTLAAVNNWRATLESSPIIKQIPEIFDEEEPVAPSQMIIGCLDKEMRKFENQIHVTTLVLDTLGKCIINPSMKTQVGHSFLSSRTVVALPNQICEASSKNEEVQWGLGTNKNSPSLCISTLESLGLVYEDSSRNWCKKEIEEKFHILVTCFMMDAVTIKERGKTQQVYQNNMEKDFILESEKVVTVLKNFTQLDSNHEIKLLVTTCLSHLKEMVRMFSQTVILAMQSGALHHEQHALKIINVMINHAANLRQGVEDISPPLKFTGSSTNKPKQRKSPDILGRNTSSAELQLKSSSILELKNYQSSETLETNVNIVEERNDTNEVHSLVWSGADCNGAERMNHRSSRRSDLIKNIPLYLLLVLTSFAFIVLIEWTYPWCWFSWNDMFSPFVKKIYPDSPPAT